MIPAKKLTSDLHVEEVEELVPLEEVVGAEVEMTSMAKVLETNQFDFDHILARIFSFLDTPDVKRASLVSR